MWHWQQPGWDDQLVERMVDDAIAQGRVTPPEWVWPLTKPYNGASGEQRVLGWQKVKVAMTMRLMPWPKQCSICLVSGKGMQYHNENYFRPLQAKPICPGCHRTLHRRYREPRPWRMLVARCNYEGAWFADLPMVEPDYSPRAVAAPVASPAPPPPAEPTVRKRTRAGVEPPRPKKIFSRVLKV